MYDSAGCGLVGVCVCGDVVDESCGGRRGVGTSAGWVAEKVAVMAQGFTQGLSHPTSPATVPDNKFRRRHRTLVTTPTPLVHRPDCHHLSTIPIIPQEKTHQFSVYVYTHVCVRVRTYAYAPSMYIYIYVCVKVCVFVCACRVCECATAPPIRIGPEGPSRIRFVYVYSIRSI